MAAHPHWLADNTQHFDWSKIVWLLKNTLAALQNSVAAHPHWLANTTQPHCDLKKKSAKRVRAFVCMCVRAYVRVCVCVCVCVCMWDSLLSPSVSSLELAALTALHVNFLRDRVFI